jgi:tetratricopeptide (TPR) repeat protein
MSKPEPSKSGANKPEASKPAAKASPPPNTPGKGAAPVAAAGPVPNLFRKIDWITAAFVTLVVLIGYIYTLAPQVTLEDSGELAVGSFYAGVPHPPGYPVWTIYTWLFTVLFPVSNIAYRVAMSSAVAGAVSCGLLALIVSRGSSMMIEGIGRQPGETELDTLELKTLDKKIESALCVISGFVAGLLLGFNGFMWSQAVIVEVYTFSVVSLMLVLVTLLRWIHAPHQRKYLYWCAFWFGICFTNHQTLIVAAMGIEVAVLAASIALGRDLFAFNSIIYLLALFIMAKGGLTGFRDNPALMPIFHLVGLGSIATASAAWWKSGKMLTEWKAALIMGAMVLLGWMFYFYMPITSMTNPPMNWGYPRTEEGFWHALTRGQYDKTSPINSAGKFIDCSRMYIEGAVDEFNFVYLMIGLLPWFYFSRMQKRERAWMIGLGAIYLMLAVLLMVLLNPNTDKQAQEQARVFFTASHVIIAMAIGYGVSLIGATLALYYTRFREIALWSAAAAVAIAIWALYSLKSLYKLDQYNAIFSLILAAALVVLILLNRQKIPLGILFGMFVLMPVDSILSHWADNEQRGHLFGYWFGHDMFTPPYGIYPPMTTNAVLFGGTDPGRFNPTYMIFCESFVPDKTLDPNFNRRDVYLITQNALADGTYLSYIRAHYNRSTQIDPPFFVNFFRSNKEEEEGRTNLFAKMFVPVDRFFTDFGAKVEARRRAEGVYPRTEIYTPTPTDSSIAFSNYISDAQIRLQHDMQFPNEPKRIRVGEDVRIIDNKISVSGQVAVMAINGLLTKVIFEKNPDHEFFVEESFPLDWMFPYLTPFGVIMKINRQPVTEFTEDMMMKDHEFWSKYSERFIGNWITYDTPTKDICAFAESVFLRRDFKNFKGSPMFVRDDNAQKAFSKLRSAIGNLYFWHLNSAKTPAEQKRLFKEAEFAFKQSFAFCPYSPEAVFKFVNLLINLERADEAQMVVETWIKFDPENQSAHSLLANIAEIKKGQAANQANRAVITGAEQAYRTNPGDLTAALQLASIYMAQQRTGDAAAIFQQLEDRPDANATTLLNVAKAYSEIGDMKGLESSLSKLVKVLPDNPEAWYDLSRAQVVVRKIPEAMNSLSNALHYSNERLAKNPAEKNLAAQASNDVSFAPIKNTPEFQKTLQVK